GSAAEARETSLRATATYLGLLFASLKSDVVKFDEIITKVQRFVPEEGHTEERILERMKEIWGALGASRELSAKYSVLAQTGIVNATDFDKLHQDSRDDDAVENYAFVENCEYSWLLI
ncbi:hypothetical protein E3A20_13270, partial [Planctomyces bekefii]